MRPDPIDAALDACLAKPEGSSTVGMVECASQRRWVAFREAEHEAMGGPWQQNRGTIIRVLTASTDLSAIKERVQELQLYGPDGG
jgi:uncharacterized protein YecT (DUF1311 family)